MKKKLIAIVASLAMVATMVPATAFATGATPAKVEVKALVAESSATDDCGYIGALAENQDLEDNLDNVTFMTGGTTIVVKGSLPYKTLTGFSNTKSLQEGNYIGIEAALTDATSDGSTKTLKNWYIKTNATHTVSGVDYKTTDLVKLSSPEGIVQRLSEGKVSSFDFYCVADADKPDASKANVFYTNVSNTEKGAIEAAYSTAAVKPTTDLANWEKDHAKNGKTFKVTLDTKDVTILTEEETKALKNFVEAVNEIQYADENDQVDAAYERHIDSAQRAYDGLDSKLQTVIVETDLQEKEHNYKQAYNTLEAAKKNVEADALIEKVAKEIKDLPDLSKTKEFKDKAEIDAVFVPMAAAKKAYDTLTETQQTTVDGKTAPVKMDTYKADYDRLIQAYVNPLYAKAAAINVEEALSPEDVALITELKAYVDGEYIATANITNFNQTTYDALVAALDKVAKDEASLENATIAAIADQAYTGAAIEPAVTVTDKAGKEVPAEEYTKIYSNNKDAGTATVTVAAKSSSAYTGSVSTTFTITPAALTDAMVKSVANATYTGAAVTPAVTVDKGVTYEVTYKNNTAVGTATAVITGTGNYSGEITKNFIVKPAKEAISSLKAGKKSLTVAYKAQTGAKYRIVYSPAKGQAKAVNTTATKKTIKNLKAGKTYKIKVRAYKTIDGTTYNGTYSTVKKVKVK